MTEQVQSSIWERSLFVRFFRWLFSWRGLRAILIVLAWFVTGVALFYGIENWRGRRAWNRYASELKARGEQLDLKAFIPKPVADPQNFAATPLIQAWFPKATWQWNDNYDKVAGKISSRWARQNKGQRQLTDLVAGQMAFEALRAGKFDRGLEFESDKFDRESRARAAAVVLEGLKDTESRLAELRAASARSHARYPVHYDLENPWGILLPHLPRIKGASQRLQLSASAKLAAGNAAGALEDIELMLYLADSLKEEPFLISYLVRVACISIAVQPIWEGLAEHRWSEAQLQKLQKRVASYNFFTGLANSLDAERAAGILTADLLYEGKYRFSHLTQPGDSYSTMSLADWLTRFAPRGWYRQEQINYSRLFDLQTEGTFDVERKRAFPGKIEQQARELERELTGSAGVNRAVVGFLRHRMLAALLLPALSRTSLRAAIAQTLTDQALMACALERYRLTNGRFPETLEALIPKFLDELPTDVLTGNAHKYRRTEDSQFVLYSPGWDERDDGGTPGKNLYDEKAGDWVWQYPAEQSKPNAALN